MGLRGPPAKKLVLPYFPPLSATDRVFAHVHVVVARRAGASLLCAMESNVGHRSKLEGSRASELYTASDVARFCQVDLKTIHNWADKGEIRHFRTPGRHLRFRRLDVLEFLRRYGYAIPDELHEGRPRLVIVDADAGAATALRRSLARRFDVTIFGDLVD